MDSRPPSCLPTSIPSSYPAQPSHAGANVDRLQAWLDNQLSDADDKVFVTKEGDDMYKIDVNGQAEYVNGEELKKLKFDLKGGRDTLVIGEGVPIGITAELGEGDDRFWGGGGNDNVKGGNGNDKIYGRGGNDHMNGGAGNDEIWGLMGHNTMIGGAGSDVFMTGAASQSLMDFTSGEDSHPTAAPSGTTTAAPVTTGTTAVPTGAPTTSTATPASTTAPAAGAAPTTGSGNYTLANHMAGPGGVGFTLTAEGTYTSKGKEFTTTMTQPGGPGTPFRTTLNYTSGPHSGTTVVYNAGPDGTSKFLAFHNPNFTPEQNAMVTKGLQNGDYLAKMLDLAMGGDSKMKKKGAHGNTSASGASGSATGSAEADTAVDGSSDGYSGLNVDGANEATSWFLVLAEGMGKIMNKFAEKMIDLLNQIEAAGDDPPYELTAKFQATSQQLAFMQQAFMTALNSLGESIKTGVTAGGAAR